MGKAPKWTAADEAMRWLNEVENVQGGANGPTIHLRAAILALGEPVRAEICDLPETAGPTARRPAAWLTESGRLCLQDGDGPVRVMPAKAEDVGFTVPLYDRHTLADVERAAAALAVGLAELRHEATRALVAWDGTVLPKAHDGLMQDRMECLRAELAELPAVGAA